MKSLSIFLSLVVLFLAGCETKKRFHLKTDTSGKYAYQYVTNDPLNVRIYELKNGLKVYLSQYKDKPRMQTQIAVKAGGKNDPASNTGLAHYLEHIMFKGTGDFGTLDWKSEAVLLDSIEHMFTHYSTLKDSVERMRYYKLIDQVSNHASKLAIPNEYDKMVSELGAQGTNAYTNRDRTVYINDIPANQLESWIQIEANRFRTIVPRLFHTELEAVYEEKNRSLDNDYWKSHDALITSIFSKHPYAFQTVIGTIDHLKNPSITEIKKYFNTYYKPNNVAICISGDLDYDKTIALIDQHFGDWQPNPDLPIWTPVVEDPITKPISKEVYGPDAEWVDIGFRFNGRSSSDHKLLLLTDMVLSNRQAGLIDINLKQQQKVLEPYSYVNEMNDYAVHTFGGRPREGQTLDDVKTLLLEQIEMVKRGEFEDWLVDAVINDLKKNRIQSSEQNWSRSNDLVVAFTNNIPWNEYVSEIDDLREYTKEDIMKFAAEHYKDNYVVVYKRNGKDPNARKVTKPAITKVTLNKENKSAFHEKILSNKVEKLQPVFLDYTKDIQRLSMNKDLEVLYTPNTENELFYLYYLTDAGTNNDPRLEVAVEYLQYIGTDDMSAEDFKKEFYKIGCEFNVFAADDRTYVYLTGIHENMEKALQLFEKLLANPKADEEALKKMIDGIFKKRDDIKKDKWAIMFSGMVNYGLYGPSSPFTNVLSNKELREVKAEELVDIIRNFSKTQHRVLYYGPENGERLVSLLNQYHTLPEELKPVPFEKEFKMKDMTSPAVMWADYDMVQEEIIFLSKGDVFDKERLPMTRMFNEYFGGGMSSPVFQELREAQGLAYAAYAFYGTPSKPTDNDFFYAYVGTQADKQAEAMDAMQKLLNDFPKSESGLEIARKSILNQIESQRINKTGILFNYLYTKKLGFDYDLRKDTYEKVQEYKMDDITKFQESYIKGKNFNVVLIGSKDKIDFKSLQRYGSVRQLTLDEIFGYEKVEKINLEAGN
jgi:predicted Zn-dependent peptidase